MAFVYRTDRPENLNPNNSDMGPGHYISQKPFITDAKQTSKPFMSGTNRENFILKNQNPGPGSYYKDPNMEYMEKLLNTSREKKKEPFYKNLDYENNNTEPYNFTMKDEKTDHLGFMTKDKRFKYSKKDMDLPGPGSYLFESQFKSNKKSLKSQLSKKGSKKILLEETDPPKIMSIPTRTQGFGYEINEENSTLLNLDPEQNKKYTGVKEDRVGPGQYDLIKEKDWVSQNKGTSWGKSKTNKTDFTANKITKNDELINSINERNFQKTEDIKQTRLVQKEHLYKHLREKNEQRKENVMKQKNSNFEKVMINVRTYS